MMKGKSHEAEKRRNGRNTICIFRQLAGEHSVFTEVYHFFPEITLGRYLGRYCRSFYRQGGRGSEKFNNSPSAIQSGYKVKPQTQDTCYLHLRCLLTIRSWGRRSHKVTCQERNVHTSEGELVPELRKHHRKSTRV